jgi:hypothetical protein
MDRFRQQLEVMTILSRHVKKIGCGSLPREKQNLTPRTKRAYLNREVDPGHLRHDHIGDKKVWTAHLSSLQCFQGICKGSREEAALSQNRCQGEGDDALIIDYKDFWLLLRIHDLPRDLEYETRQVGYSSALFHDTRADIAVTGLSTQRRDQFHRNAWDIQLYRADRTQT